MVHPDTTYGFDRRGLGSIPEGPVDRCNIGCARYDAFHVFKYSKSRNILLSMIVRERLFVFHSTPESRASEWGLLSSLLISKSSGDTRWCAENAFPEFRRGLYLAIIYVECLKKLLQIPPKIILDFRRISFEKSFGVGTTMNSICGHYILHRTSLGAGCGRHWVLGVGVGT